jgi:hypothetical protein
MLRIFAEKRPREFIPIAKKMLQEDCPRIKYQRGKWDLSFSGSPLKKFPQENPP